LEQKCLLVVYAHPDDKVFGTGGVLRTYSDEGVRTALICATRGEAGEIADAALATSQTIARVREGELRESCRILGVEDLVVLGCHDGRLAEADPAEVQGCIVREMRRLRPQVVVTFDAAGVYGHPDHRAIHRLTVGAFHQAGDPTCYPEQIDGGVQPYAPQKRYVTASSQSSMRQTRAGPGRGLPLRARRQRGHSGHRGDGHARRRDHHLHHAERSGVRGQDGGPASASHPDQPDFVLAAHGRRTAPRT
jgi:LmbE family N-acetylglucosaminyl deacetylase